MPKRRLDTLLAEQGLFPSRSSAAASVMAGEVHVGPGRRVAGKPSEMVEEDEPIEVRRRAAYVSRGGVKLANALAASGVEVTGRRALDVGASTGGFTDCLLQSGASEVVALDVAYGQFDYGLRGDERVHVIERVNARALTAETLPYAPDLAVIDVSFISLTKVLPAVLGVLAGRHDVLALVKPQFEVGRGKVGKGGVVRDPELRRQALLDVGEAALALGEAVLGFFPSGLPGPKGNRESFVWLAERARAAEQGERAEQGWPAGRGRAAEQGQAAGHGQAAGRGSEAVAAAATQEDLLAMAKQVEP
jgi:23S rRNA (cytidine1920-2'-O)/16S rRNA (cytidine1409-2'-O)-methyltransferase